MPEHTHSANCASREHEWLLIVYGPAARRPPVAVTVNDRVPDEAAALHPRDDNQDLGVFSAQRTRTMREMGIEVERVAGIEPDRLARLTARRCK